MGKRSERVGGGWQGEQGWVSWLEVCESMRLALIYSWTDLRLSASVQTNGAFVCEDSA